MAAIEDQVLTKLLRAQSLREALKVGLTEKHFKNNESRQIYRFFMEHWFNPNTAKTLPPLSRIQRTWPAFTPTAVNDNDDSELTSVIDELKMLAFESDARGMVEYFQELVDEDPINAVKVIKGAVNDMSLAFSGHVNRYTGLADIAALAKKQYEGAQTGAIYGVPWPWPCLTQDTLGKRGGDFVIFYGRMKSMKTWILLYCATVDFVIHNRRVLVWSREMSEIKLGLRVASILAKVDYQIFKKGLLPPKLEMRTFQILNDLVVKEAKTDLYDGAKKGSRDLMLLSGRDAPKTLDELKTWVDQFQPDVIYLDSFYHMDSTRSSKIGVRWQRVATLAEDIKSYAEDIRIPIIATHQANRLGEKTYGNTLADIADADVIGREADTIIRVIKRGSSRELYEEEYEEELDEMIAKFKHIKGLRKSKVPTIKLGMAKDPDLLLERCQEWQEKGRKGSELACVLGGNREGVLEAFRIHAVPGYNFDIIDDNCTTKDIKKWIEQDNKGDDELGKYSGKRKKKGEEERGDFTSESFETPEMEKK